MQKKKKIVTKTFDIQQSIKRAKDSKQNSYIWSIELQDKKYVWTSKMDRVAIIRKG